MEWALLGKVCFYSGGRVGSGSGEGLAVLLGSTGRCGPVCMVHADESVSCELGLWRLGELGAGSMAIAFPEILAA